MALYRPSRHCKPGITARQSCCKPPSLVTFATAGEPVSPPIRDHPINAAGDFDQGKAEKGAGAEFQVMGLQQVLAYHRDLQVFRRLPAPANVQLKIRRYSRGKSGKNI